MKSSLRTNSIKNITLKLSRHREMGNKSELNIFQVAVLMDRLKYANELETSSDSLFFNPSWN
jgi:hypothetical protein